jgi:hypothetical protein
LNNLTSPYNKMEATITERMKTLSFDDIEDRWNLQACLFWLTHSTKMQKRIRGAKSIKPAHVKQEVCSRLVTLIEQRASSARICHPNRPLELLMLSAMNHQIAIIGCLLPIQPMPMPLQLQQDDDFHRTLLKLLTFVTSLKTLVQKKQAVCNTESGHDDNSSTNASLPRIELPSQWPEFMLPKGPPSPPTLLITEEHMCILPKL